MHHWRRSVPVDWNHGFPVLVGIAVVSSLLYFPLNSGSVLADVPEILVPLATSLFLASFAVWLSRNRDRVGEVARIAKYGWFGALGAASVGLWWVALHLLREVPVGGLANEVLTVLSLGIATGVLAGTRVARPRLRRPARERVLAETTWANRPGQEAITVAVAELLADLEGVDPLEIDPLYERIDPGVFEALRERGDSPWQVTFYVDGYEIRVGSQGTVTAYDADRPAESPSRSDRTDSDEPR